MVINVIKDDKKYIILPSLFIKYLFLFY